MAKKNRKSPKKSSHIRTTAEIAEKNEPEGKNRSLRFGRETIDALVVAFVLAFLIRTFEAEQFVIPTGSMAPTLMGRHKDVGCVECNHRFRVNASNEAPDAAQQLIRNNPNKNFSDIVRQVKASQTVASPCPQCGYVMPFREDGIKKLLPKGTAEIDRAENYGGDRIVVNKYAYSIKDPDRWDVIVFKYPGGAMANYIRRLIGLPEETLRIFHGDIYTKPLTPEDKNEFAIQRKPADKVLALRQFVHDTDYDPKNLYNAGWPLRWSSQSEAWKLSTKESGLNIKQTYSIDSKSETEWLRYEHIVPTEAVWNQVLGNPSPSTELQEQLASSAKPKLIGDFVAYNAGILHETVITKQRLTSEPLRRWSYTSLGLHWVGDLSLDASIQVKSDAGLLHFDLVESGTHYGATIDVATGEATFTSTSFESKDAEVLSKAMTSLKGSGNYEVRFANVDDQLLLWIDDDLVQIDGAYSPADSTEARSELVPRTSETDLGDLAPVGIGVENAAVEISRMQVHRDIYYLAERRTRKERSQNGNFITDLSMNSLYERSSRFPEEILFTLLETPENWDLFSQRRFVDFEIAEDQFFVLGDNSASSLDARLWAGGNGDLPGIPGGPYLERHLLVGKALCVYWPHAWASLPYTNKLVPLWPNFADMRMIR